MSSYADFGGLVTRVGMGSEAKVASSGVARSGGNAAAIGGVIVAFAFATVLVVRVPAKFAVVFALAFELSLAIGLVSLADVFAVVVVVVAPVEVLVA